MFAIFALLTVSYCGSVFNASEMWESVEPEIRAAGSNATFDDFEAVVSSFAGTFDWQNYNRAQQNSPVQVFQRKPMGNCDPNRQGIVNVPQTPPRPPKGLFAPSTRPTPQQMMMQKMISGAASSQSTSVLIAQMMAMTAVQTVSSIAMEIMPQGIPPPVWNLRPLPCVPMTVGRNCIGAIKYPITMSDLILAQNIDDSLDTIIEGFPDLFNDRTLGMGYPYEIYKRCFQTYMSMQCASVFPTCTNPQSQQAFIPMLGRMPICAVLCLQVLTACPGFRYEDIQSACTHMSPMPPPLCAYATYDREDAIPPPVGSDSDDDSSGCPPLDADQDLGVDPTLDDDVTTPVLDLNHLPILRDVA